MKKLGIIISFLLLLAVSAVFAGAEFSGIDEEFSFRGVTWGMARHEVTGIESGVLEDTAEGDEFQARYKLSTPVFGLGEASAFYLFTDEHLAEVYTMEADRLFGMGVVFNPYELHDEAALNDYKQLLDILTARFGEPVFKGVWDDGQLITTVNDPLYSSWGDTMNENAQGRAFWNGDDFYIITDLTTAEADTSRHMYVYFMLVPGGPSWDRLKLKE